MSAQSSLGHIDLESMSSKQNKPLLVYKRQATRLNSNPTTILISPTAPIHNAQSGKNIIIPFVHAPFTNNDAQSNLDQSIALCKAKQSSSHLLHILTSYDHLSLCFQAFISSIGSHSIPKSSSDALWNPGWLETICKKR